MNRLVLAVLVFGLAVGTAGCESATTIPAGAQQVRVDATATSVQLTPASVHAGDVYLVLGLPQGIALAFVRSSSGGALTDADLARLAQNEDIESISSEAMDVSCCGNVYKRTLAPGKYAFVVHPESTQPGLPPAAIAVLDVQP